MAKIKVDEELCIGCGTCTNIAPDFFELKDNDKGATVSVPKQETDSKTDDIVNKAIDACPVGAISLEE